MILISLGVVLILCGLGFVGWLADSDDDATDSWDGPDKK